LFVEETWQYRTCTMELRVHNTFLHAFELEDHDLDFIRTQSEPSGCSYHAMSSGHMEQLNKFHGATTVTADIPFVSWEQNSLPQSSPAKSVKDACPADVPVYCSRDPSLSSIHTSALSDKVACNWHDSLGKLVPPTQQYEPCVKIDPVVGTAPAQLNDAVAMTMACARFPQESLTGQAIMSDAAVLRASKFVCDLPSAPSSFTGVVMPHAVSLVIAHPNTRKSSRPDRVQDECQSSGYGKRGSPSLQHMSVKSASPKTLVSLPLGVFQEAVTTTLPDVGNIAASKQQVAASQATPGVMSAALRNHWSTTSCCQGRSAGSELPFGAQHRFHDETSAMGWLSADARHYTKMGYEGHLSIVTENRVHSAGLLRYAVQFTAGKMSSADGVGFIFSPSLPNTKNIKQIVSIFANSAGRICFRAGGEVFRSRMSLQPLAIGDWIELSVDLDSMVAYFRTVSSVTDRQSSQASFPFGGIFKNLKKSGYLVPDSPNGYFACVVRNLGVSVKLGS